MQGNSAWGFCVLTSSRGNKPVKMTKQSQDQSLWVFAFLLKSSYISQLEVVGRKSKRKQKKKNIVSLFNSPLSPCCFFTRFRCLHFTHRVFPGGVSSFSACPASSPGTFLTSICSHPSHKPNSTSCGPLSRPGCFMLCALLRLFTLPGNPIFFVFPSMTSN